MSLILRQQKTLELVRERGYISIEELAQYFDVTPQTIRRDINQLADEGLLRRYHGGAAHDSSVENTEYTMRVGYMRHYSLILERPRNRLPKPCSTILG